MPPKRNRRAGVEDLWWKTVHTEEGGSTRIPSKLHGTGKRWRARYVDDRGQERTRRFEKKADAQKWLDQITSEHVTGTYVDPTRKAELFGTLAEQWFATKATKQPKTVAGYRSLLDTQVLPRWGEVRVGDITYEEVQIWVSGLSTDGHTLTGEGLSASRVIQAYQVLNQVLRYAIRAKRIAVNPAGDIELPRKVEPEKRYLTHSQVHTLASASDRFEVLVFVLAYCGLRFGEAVALRVRNVDLDRRRLWVAASATAVRGQGIVEGPTKNHSARSVPIPSFLAELLEPIVERDENALVFPGRKGGFLPLGELRWVFDQAATTAGLPGLTPHELRHTAASLAIAAGANIKVIQRMLGHKTATLTLDRYGHLFQDDLDTVAASLDTAAREVREDAAYALRTEQNAHTLERPALAV
ncbi:tyrosine-type recombinase/integrase [Rhodococcus aetherivorans]|uniref:tyrosine-type recombinase/integrase n=1 Tax=Rhodococcus aetherivorans TaxID=191292 RepID=UPI0002D23790|nr:site-specific integrase [Rhodococcus aetherivorans]CCW13211.1 Integrase [Rhodococcus aetherivorans]